MIRQMKSLISNIGLKLKLRSRMGSLSGLWNAQKKVSPLKRSREGELGLR